MEKVWGFEGEQPRKNVDGLRKRVVKNSYLIKLLPYQPQNQVYLAKMMGKRGGSVEGVLIGVGEDD